MSEGICTTACKGHEDRKAAREIDEEAFPERAGLCGTCLNTNDLLALQRRVDNGAFNAKFAVGRLDAGLEARRQIDTEGKALKARVASFEGDLLGLAKSVKGIVGAEGVVDRFDRKLLRFRRYNEDALEARKRLLERVEVLERRPAANTLERSLLGRLEHLERANSERALVGTEKTVGDFTEAQIGFLLEQGWHQTAHTKIGNEPAMREFTRSVPRPATLAQQERPETIASVLSAMDPDTIRSVLCTAILSAAACVTALSAAAMALQ